MIDLAGYAGPYSHGFLLQVRLWMSMRLIFIGCMTLSAQWLSGLGADGADLRSLGSGRAVL